MSVKLFFQNYTQSDLSTQARRLEGRFTERGVNVQSLQYALAPTLTALGEAEPTCILRFEPGDQDQMRLVLTHNNSVSSETINAIQCAISDIQPELPVKHSALEQASILSEFNVGAYRISGHLMESGDTVYTIEITLATADGRAAIHSIELTEDQAMELNQLNPGKYGAFNVLQSFNVLTDSALYHTLRELGCPLVGGARRRNALIEGAKEQLQWENGPYR